MHDSHSQQSVDLPYPTSSPLPLFMKLCPSDRFVGRLLLVVARYSPILVPLLVVLVEQ